MEKPPRRNRYVALEELDMIWDEPQIKLFRSLVSAGADITQIAKRLKRHKVEVAAFALDQLSWPDAMKLFKRIPAVKTETEARSTSVRVVRCAECGEEFERENSKVKLVNFCSRSCMGQAFSRQRKDQAQGNRPKKKAASI